MEIGLGLYCVIVDIFVVVCDFTHTFMKVK